MDLESTQSLGGLFSSSEQGGHTYFFFFFFPFVSPLPWERPPNRLCMDRTWLLAIRICTFRVLLIPLRAALRPRRAASSRSDFEGARRGGERSRARPGHTSETGRLGMCCNPPAGFVIRQNLFDSCSRENEVKAVDFVDLGRLQNVHQRRGESILRRCGDQDCASIVRS